MKKSDIKWSKWLQWFAFAVAIIIFYKILDNFTDILNWFTNLFSVLMPFLMGIFIAYIFYTPCKKIENIYNKSKLKIIKKKARTLSILTVYLIVVLLIVLVFRFIIPNISQSVSEIINNLPTYYEQAMKWIENIPEDSMWNKIDIKSALQNIQNIDVSSFFNIDAIAGYAKGVISFATSIFDIFLTIIISIYILSERTRILKFVKKLCKAVFKEKTYDNIGKYFARSNRIFFNFLTGQIIDAIVISVLTSIAMSILGVKYAVLLGVLIGISNLIPYFGAIVGVSSCVIITIFTGGITQAIWMAIVVIVLQQIDANIINPKILGESLKISPLLVIFSVTVAGAYFGILGMFLAVPIATLVKLIIEDYIDYKNLIKEKYVEEKE